MNQSNASTSFLCPVLIRQVSSLWCLSWFFVSKEELGLPIFTAYTSDRLVSHQIVTSYYHFFPQRTDFGTIFYHDITTMSFYSDLAVLCKRYIKIMQPFLEKSKLCKCAPNLNKIFKWLENINKLCKFAINTALFAKLYKLCTIMRDEFCTMQSHVIPKVPY